MVIDRDARAEIVAAADALYYARGIHEVGMDSVREESGLSLKRIYSVFPSKADLVVAVLEERRAAWDRDLAKALEQHPEPRDKLLAIFDFLRVWFAADDFRGCIFINSFSESAPTSDSVRDIVRAQKADFQRLVERLSLDAGGTTTLARQLALLAEGAQTSAAIGRDPSWADDARHAAESLIDLALAVRTP